MLGFDVSERTVSRWMRRAPRDTEPAKRWFAFLSNHREAIAAMDFFTVPTINFSVLYCFFIIGHDRRRILHFNVTRHPTSAWTIQQLREAFPVSIRPKVLDFRPQPKYALSSDRCPIPEYHTYSDFIREPVAERSCREVDRELPPRHVGPCDRGQRGPPETAVCGIHPVLPR